MVEPCVLSNPDDENMSVRLNVTNVSALVQRAISPPDGGPQSVLGPQICPNFL